MPTSPRSASRCSTPAVNWSTTRWADLLALPFTPRQEASQSFPQWVVAQKGMFLSLSGGRLPVIGSACSRDPVVADTTSLYEAVERLLTRACAAGDDRWLTGHRAADAAVTVRESLAAVLPWPDSGSTRVTDGTGLAVHRDPAAAETHAVWELLERALVTRLWYGPGLALQPVSPTLRQGRCALRAWTLIGADGCFAVADAYDPDGPAHTLGAAVRGDPARAVEHARAEAVMLLDSAQRGCMPTHVQHAARARAGTIAGPLAPLRRAHLEQAADRLQRTGLAARGIWTLWRHAAVDPGDVAVFTILEGPDWVLVRAVADNVVLPRDARHRPDYAHIVSDPLC